MSPIRYFFSAVLLVFVLTGCARKQEDIAPTVDRADLTEKTWTSRQVDFLLDGQSWSEKTPAATGSWTFRENGTYSTTDEDGQTELGTWELAGRRIKLQYRGSTGADYLTITRLEDKTLVLNLIEDLDLTKKRQEYSLTELTFFTMTASYFEGRKIDISQNKKVSIHATLLAK